MKVGTLRVMRQQCISLPILSRLVTGTASGVAKGLSGVKPLNWLSENAAKYKNCSIYTLKILHWLTEK